MEQTNLTVRPITGPEELDLFCQLSYGLNTAAVLPSGTPAEYSRFVPPDWRENGRQDVEDRMAVLARTAPSCSSNAYAWNGVRRRRCPRPAVAWRSGPWAPTSCSP